MVPQSERPTCFELRAALRELPLSQADFAKACGVAKNTVWRWCMGMICIPDYVWTILSLHAGRTLGDVLAGKIVRFELLPGDVFNKGLDRKDYIRLVKRFHTDGGSRDSRAEIQIINAMYDVVKKMRHDGYL